MDQSVLDALVRWPDVPAAFGWLSLDPRGNWRLHEGGDSASGQPGDSITNTQIIGFMNRNYDHDDIGRWFFQNGPQRVYVRVDTAPYVLRLTGDGELITHTQADAGRISSWWLDEQGRLYAMAECGPGAIDDRDLMAVLDGMTLDEGAGQDGVGDPDPVSMLATLSRMTPGDTLTVRHRCSPQPMPLLAVRSEHVPDALGFVRAPAAPDAGVPSAGENVR